VEGHLVTHNGIVGAYSYEDERGCSDTLELTTQEKFGELLLSERWEVTVTSSLGKTKVR
jgi:hypothetical protein